MNTAQPKITKNSEIIRAMRPFQRIAAKLLIADVLAQTPPASLQEARTRYSKRMGEGFLIDNGKGWRDDIRDTSIDCLIKNGFAKAKAVQLRRKTGQLLGWSTSEHELEQAAKLETEYSSSLKQMEQHRIMLENSSFVGDGEEAVYTYTDSLLDELNFFCTKIGRHMSSDPSSVAMRVLTQYGTSNAGRPVLRNVFQTNDAVGLERALHDHFKNFRLETATGTEWFKVSHESVLDEFHRIQEQSS